MTALRRKMTEDLQIQGLSVRSAKLYLGCVRVFATHHGRSPARLGTDEVRAFLLHKRQEGRRPATLVVYHAALRFLYDVTLQRPEVMAPIPRPRVPRRDIVASLSVDEIRALLDATETAFDRTLFGLLYGCGLRAAEGCSLQTGDIDARAGIIHLRQCKGGIARSVPLSDAVLRLLREHWRQTRPPGTWLFPARRLSRPGVTATTDPWSDHPVALRTMSDRFRKVRAKAGLRRRVCLHDLRRAYAAPALEGGTDLRVVQVLLGHARPETTALYTPVSPALLRRTPCPLEQLSG